MFDINAGDGAVTLFNTGHGSDGDAVRFDVDKSDLWFLRSGNDLTVRIIGTSDAVSLSGWYSDGADRVSTFQDGQGETLSSGSVDALVYAMSAFAPPAAGQLDMTTEQHFVLDPIIAANWL